MEGSICRTPISSAAVLHPEDNINQKPNLAGKTTWEVI